MRDLIRESYDKAYDLAAFLSTLEDTLGHCEMLIADGKHTGTMLIEVRECLHSCYSTVRDDVDAMKRLAAYHERTKDEQEKSQRRVISERSRQPKTQADCRRKGQRRVDSVADDNGRSATEHAATDSRHREQ